MCVCVRERDPLSVFFPCNKTHTILKRVFRLYSSYEANPNQFNPLNCVYLVIRLFVLISLILLDFPGGSDSKESTCNVGDLDSIPGLGRSPGEGKGYPLQYSGLENPMDRGANQNSLYFLKHKTCINEEHSVYKMNQLDQ